MSDKASLRKEILTKRDSIPPAVKHARDKAIEDRMFLLPEFKTAKTVFFFASFRSEVDTFGMIGRALGEGRRVVLPRVEGRLLGLYEIRSVAELVPGYMKIPEPSALTDDRKKNINDVDAIIIPGAAFDENGNRIGYGGGFYDRLLSTLQRKVPVMAVCYEDQIVPAVPAEPHDIRIYTIITDKRVVRITDRA